MRFNDNIQEITVQLLHTRKYIFYEKVVKMYLWKVLSQTKTEFIR